MELLVSTIIVFMITFTIFGVVNMLKQINDLPNEYDTNKKRKPKS